MIWTLVALVLALAVWIPFALFVTEQVLDRMGLALAEALDPEEEP